jgi:tryptophanyl-tRNA synthetase
MSNNLEKKRILTGDNTTGNLHVGHYVGSLENRVKLQDEYELIIVAADLHALAYPKYIENTQLVAQGTYGVIVGNLAAGLDPEKTTFFVDSAIPQISELALLFSMLVTTPRILRNPTIKDEIRDKGLTDTYSLGFLNFPLLMAADILAANADLVPIGQDQLPHLELTKEIVHKFNSTYKPVLKEPQPLIGRIARLIGTDGNSKMTKSLGNAIFLNEPKDSLKAKIMSMYTDPNRIHATDPGKVEGNPVFIYHDAFNPNKAEVEDLKQRYRAGKVGDVEVKTKLLLAMETFLAPIQERHAYYESKPDLIKDLLNEGNKKVEQIASQTLLQVKEALQLFT